MLYTVPAHSAILTDRFLLSQLNIFLAILIEGYSAVKEGAEKSAGMDKEIIAVVAHELHCLAHMLGFSPNFISDYRLCHELEDRLRSSALTIRQAVHDFSTGARESTYKVQPPVACTKRSFSFF